MGREGKTNGSAASPSTFTFSVTPTEKEEVMTAAVYMSAVVALLYLVNLTAVCGRPAQQERQFLPIVLAILC